MNKVFIGPLAHWIVVLILIGLSYLVGHAKLHVTNFNLFLVLLILGTVGALGLLLATARPGTRVTRDPIEDPGEDPGETSEPPRADRTSQS